MYNILIVEKDLKQIEKIFDKLYEFKENLRVLNIATNVKKTNAYVNSKKYDIIILGTVFIELLNFIEKNNYINYKKSIILLKRLKENFCYNMKGNEYLFNIISINELNLELENIIKFKDCYEIRSKIHKELNYLKYNYIYIGTKYLEDVIFEIYKNKDSFDGNLTKNIYPIIAKKYNKTVETIYGDMKLATKYMLLDCKEEIIIKYFNYYSFTAPKLKEIILVILNKIL